MKRAVKAQNQGARTGLGVAKLRLMPCQRSSPSGLGTFALLAEDKLVLARMGCRAERWKAEVGGCEDSCIKYPCKSRLQGLKKTAQLGKKNHFFNY